MNLLVLHVEADYIKSVLEPQFPELSIQAFATEEEAVNAVEQADILYTIRCSDAFIKKASRVQWIQCMITGVDYLVNLPSFPRDVLLTSTRGIHGPQMSEIAFLLMLALNRQFPRNVRNQDKRIWERWPTKLLYQKSVAILGVGIIGREIARKCQAFDMTVHGITSTKRTLEFVDHAHGPDELLEVLAEVDYFINVVPSSSRTINLIGKKELEAMKPTAFYISMGRGDTVDEQALTEVLAAKRIAGAAMDVFAIEPLPADSPLWGMENVIVLPHIGGMSDIYVDQALPIFEENLRRYLKGERRDLINFIDLTAD